MQFECALYPALLGWKVWVERKMSREGGQGGRSRAQKNGGVRWEGRKEGVKIRERVKGRDEEHSGLTDRGNQKIWDAHCLIGVYHRAEKVVPLFVYLVFKFF